MKGKLTVDQVTYANHLVLKASRARSVTWQDIITPSETPTLYVHPSISYTSGIAVAYQVYTEDGPTARVHFYPVKKRGHLNVMERAQTLVPDAMDMFEAADRVCEAFQEFKKKHPTARVVLIHEEFQSPRHARPLGDVKNAAYWIYKKYADNKDKRFFYKIPQADVCASRIRCAAMGHIVAEYFQKKLGDDIDFCSARSKRVMYQIGLVAPLHKTDVEKGKFPSKLWKLLLSDWGMTVEECLLDYTENPGMVEFTLDGTTSIMTKKEVLELVKKVAGPGPTRTVEYCKFKVKLPKFKIEMTPCGRNRRVNPKLQKLLAAKFASTFIIKGATPDEDTEIDVSNLSDISYASMISFLIFGVLFSKGKAYFKFPYEYALSSAPKECLLQVSDFEKLEEAATSGGLELSELAEDIDGEYDDED